MSNRRRLDGQPTADEIQLARDNCEEHIASFQDPEVCVHCRAPMELPRSVDDAVDDLAETLPPSDQIDGAAIVAAAHERQAEAAADSAPVGGEAPAGEGDNSKSKYEIIKEKFERLQAIKAEQKALRDEAADIVDDLDKQQGVNRGALSEIRKMHGLDAATITRRETSRKELFDLLIKPKLEEAEAGQADE